ncbi:MAG: hypothetical protein ACRCXZ_09740 [Patescibacteria group bacterium]
MKMKSFYQKVGFGSLAVILLSTGALFTFWSKSDATILVIRKESILQSIGDTGFATTSLQASLGFDEEGITATEQNYRNEYKKAKDALALAVKDLDFKSNLLWFLLISDCFAFGFTYGYTKSLLG